MFRARDFVFLKKESRDQKSAKNETKIDADPPRFVPSTVIFQVAPDHEENCDSTQNIYRLIAKVHWVVWLASWWLIGRKSNITYSNQTSCAADNTHLSAGRLGWLEFLEPG